MSASPASLEVEWSQELSDHVISVDVSRDGRRVAAADVSGQLAVFDAQRGEALWRKQAHRFGISELALSADGTLVASAGQDGQVRMFETGSGRLCMEREAGAEWAEHVAWCPTENWLLCGAGKHLSLWDRDGSLRCIYPQHPATIADIAWQPGRARFASVTYGFVSLFTPDSPKPLKQLPWKGSMLKLAWQPQGKYLATGNQDASIQFWVLDKARDLQMHGYDTKIRELSWDPSGRFLASGGGKEIVVWDCRGRGPAGTKPRILKWHLSFVSALCFQPRGPLLASGGLEGMCAIWSMREPGPLHASDELGSGVTQLAWAGDAPRLIAGTEKGRLLALTSPGLKQAPAQND